MQSTGKKRYQNIWRLDGLMKGTLYNSSQAMKLFEPTLRHLVKGSYGNQLEIPKAKTFSITNKYRQGLAQDNTQIKDSVDLYIRSYNNTAGKLSQFTQVLGNRVQQAKNAALNYTLEQLSVVFPWVFSCEALMEPIRSIIYAIGNDLKPESYGDIITIVTGDAINLEVNRIILNDLMYMGPVLTLTMEIFQNKGTGILAKLWTSWLQTQNVWAKAFDRGFQAAVRAFKRLPGSETISNITSQIWDTVRLGSYAFFGHIPKQSNQEHLADRKQMDQDMKAMFIKFMFKDMFNNLKVYGSVVLNFNLIKFAGIKVNYGGKAFYYFSNYPTILFSIEDSIVVPFRKIQGSMVKIPQSQFTISYLRTMSATYVQNFGEGMFNEVRGQLTRSKDQKRNLYQFSENYLRFGHNKHAGLNQEVLREHLNKLILGKKV